MLPEEVFCFEGVTKHLTGFDLPCESHASTTSGQRQVLVNFCKLQAAIRKESNRAVKAKANLPVIKIIGIAGDRPIVPITLFSAMEYSYPGYWGGAGGGCGAPSQLHPEVETPGN